MDNNELLAVFDREQRIEVHYPGTVREVTAHVIRSYDPDERFGFIAYFKLDDADVDAEIEAQIAYFDAMHMPFEWKVYDHDRPADLRQRLAARGFEIEEAEALMVLDLNNAPDFYDTLALPENLEQVTTRAGIDDIIRMEDEVWNDSWGWLGENLNRSLENHPELLRIYAARAEGRIVSAAWMYLHPPTQFASLWGGSTLPAHRRHGYYTALLVARAREARRCGCRFLTVDASPMSRPILEKHGFVFLEFSTPCKWKPEAQPGAEQEAS